ncbi:unnamed protein product [Auanema sp. JU1783]|nr:unnamed protein product [Auanema sp. JU1783]
MSEEYESVALVKPEVFIYKIPPLANNKGHKAVEWSLDNPDWSGRLKLVGLGKRLELRLEDKTTGAHFATCPIDAHPGLAVEPVSDSSRYFVIRLLQKETGKTVFIGLGFADRGDAFDFNVALQDHFKYVEKSAEFEQNEKNTQPALDLAFKEGQTISINLKKNNDGLPAAPRPRPPPTSGGIVPLLPPPPGSSNRVRSNAPVSTNLPVSNSDLLNL